MALAHIFNNRPCLTADDFDQAVLAPESGPRLKVVYFWGDNCPNCVIAKEQMSLIADELANLPVDYFSVNAYEQMDLATRFGLFGIPVFLFFKKGRLIGRITSFPTREEFLGALRRAI